MSLIYSRPRIKLPSFFLFNYNRNPKGKIKLRIFISIIIMMATFGMLIKAVTPVFNELCINKAKSMATIITNEETTNTIKDYNYSDFVIIHKDTKGNIIMLESNMINMNNVISNLANKIQNAINNTPEQDITIRLGTLSGTKILSGRGYKIPIRILTTGNVKTKVRSELIEQGINQTLHRLYLEIECEINILTPFNTINESIENQFILTENIIIGTIPETYYNIEGVTQNEAMEVIE